MTVVEQIAANVVDSKLTTYIGAGLIVMGVLCDSGVGALYLAPATEHAWCAVVAKLATYLGGAGLVVSRGPHVPPR